MNDPTETLISHSLADHATDAPPDDSLLSDVHSRLRRRRRARTTGAVVLACAAVATAITGVHHLTTEVAPVPATVAQPPAGWHWESYSNIQVQVPDGWQDVSASHYALCPRQKPAAPWVGRPNLSPTTMMACPVEVPTLSTRVPFLYIDLNPKAGVVQRDHGWTEETRVLDGVGLKVFTNDDSVRRRIVDSATLITGTDHYGCSPSHPAAQEPDLVPAPTGGLASVGSVESVRICAYQTWSGSARPPLLASAELTGDRARVVGDALIAAPVVHRPVIAASKPGLPTTGSECRPVRAEAEIVVLEVRGSHGRQEVVVRFAECTGNGFDDGIALRGLTKAALQPLLTAVDRPEALMPSVEQLLR